MSSTGGRTPTRRTVSRTATTPSGRSLRSDTDGGARSAASPRSPATPGGRRSARLNRAEEEPPPPTIDEEDGAETARPPTATNAQSSAMDADDAASAFLDDYDESPLKRPRSLSNLNESRSGRDTRASDVPSEADGRRGVVRQDLTHAAQHHRHVQLDRPATLQSEMAEAPADDGARVFIWGTRICVEDVRRNFMHFLESYVEKKPVEDELMVADEGGQHEIDAANPYYVQRASEIFITQEPFLNINLHHVRLFSEALYKQILIYPADVIPYLDQVANEFCDRVAVEGGDHLAEPVQVRPFNAERTRNMRGLNPEDIDQLITVSGMVIRTSQLIPEMRIGFFECSICKHSAEVDVDRGRIEEPIVCAKCQSKHSFQLIHNRSRFGDKQIIKLQESPDDMPAGQTPHTVTLYAYGQLVDSIQPGDRVTVTGIYRAVPLRVNPRMRVVKSVYRTHVDVLHFRKADVMRLHQEDDGTGISKVRVEQIVRLSEYADVAKRLADAIAPSIYEHDDVKRGILCLLFGGTRQPDGEGGRAGHQLRADINVLLCGDPGTSKSQLLQYVHNLVPRGQYTSGKGSSAVGLTAYVTRDPETRHFVLQTGALVLSDNGVCCIDEFDKMNDSTRAVLHEVMEQQTLSIAKAGIICQLNARASVLAAANPVDSQWNRNKTIIENVQLPHTLLSRFDLIFLLVDPQDEAYDKRLASHLVSLYYKNKVDETAEFGDMSLLRDYIAYAKANVHPELSEAAGQRLVDRYIGMRKIGSGRGQVSAYPRQLESLIRLSEANAKIRLSGEVQVADVEEAYRLHREALKQSAVDPATGRVDVNILAGGMSATTRKHVLQLAESTRALLAAKPFGNSYALRILIKELREGADQSIGYDLFDEAVNELCKNDVVTKVGDKIRLLRNVDGAA